MSLAHCLMHRSDSVKGPGNPETGLEGKESGAWVFHTQPPPLDQGESHRVTSEEASGFPKPKWTLQAPPLISRPPEKKKTTFFIFPLKSRQKSSRLCRQGVVRSEILGTLGSGCSGRPLKGWSVGPALLGLVPLRERQLPELSAGGSPKPGT